jgi:hypothetical protein
MVDDTTTTDPAPAGEADRPLGSAGEKALDAFKNRARDAERAAKEERSAREALEREVAELRTANQTDTEKLLAAARKEGAAEAIKQERERAAIRIGALMRERLEDKIAVYATGKLANPVVARRLLDLDELVDGEGAPDEAKIQTAIGELLEREPYLAADGQRKTAPADPDAGARGPAGGGDLAARARERARRMGAPIQDQQ